MTMPLIWKRIILLSSLEKALTYRKGMPSERKQTGETDRYFDGTGGGIC